MGIEYYIACTDCKVVRDLDKYYESLSNVKNRNDAKEFAEKLKTGPRGLFRTALLVSFLNDHYDHNVVFTSEGGRGEEELSTYDNPNYREDTDFWLYTDEELKEKADGPNG